MDSLKNTDEQSLVSVTLTPEQIQNWRKVLVNMIGPYALIMPDEQVQKFKDKFQADVNSLDVLK